MMLLSNINVDSSTLAQAELEEHIGTLYRSCNAKYTRIHVWLPNANVCRLTFESTINTWIGIAVIARFYT